MSAKPRAACEIRERTLELRGSRLVLLEAGDGPAVVLLHGFPDNAWSWSHQIDALASAGRRAIAPFLPGYPPSEPPAKGNAQQGTAQDDKPDEIEIVEVLEILAALIESLDQGPTALIGHDWGATIAYALAATHPDRVSRVAAMAVPHPGNAAVLLEDPALIHHTFHVWFFQLAGLPEYALAANDSRFIDYLWALWSPGLHDDAHIARVKRETLATPEAIAAALGYYRAIFKATLSGSLQLSPIAVPTLAIFGGSDPNAKLATGQETLFTGAYRHELIANAGHFLHREQPEHVNNLLNAWLDGSLDGAVMPPPGRLGNVTTTPVNRPLVGE
jgi:pimeloyl-ACP methyl ester carboxylesterase